MFSLLLLALADKAEAGPAARLASALAARHGAGLAALHVSSPLSQDAACVLQLPDEAALVRARAGVEVLLREVMPAGLTADTLHAAGFVHVEALKTTRVLGPDLLVLGGLDASERCRRELSGHSAGAAVLTALSAPCPVLAVPEGAVIPAGPFERVLVAADFADLTLDRALLALAARLAAREGADLTAFHPLRLEAAAPPRAGAEPPGQEDMTRRVAAARERLAYLCHGLPGADRFVLAASEGEGAVEILKQARERRAELIVLACRGADACVDQVLAGARRPVLLVGRGALFPVAREAA